MFPFSINNTLKLFTGNGTMESIDEDAIKDRISQAVVQSLPNKRNIKFNAIIVLECDNEQKRTIVINENINNNGQKMQLTATFPGNSFTTISTSNITNPSNVLISQQPLFPATVEGLQAILNLTSSSMTRTNMSDNGAYRSTNNGFSFVPIKTENVENAVKVEKSTENNETGLSSRKRKSEKPCRIPQDSVAESNGLDLTLGGRYEKVYHQNNVPIWPSPVNTESKALVAINQPIIMPRVKRPPQLPGHKKSSKIFNCNQCKLQFNSLNALCKHTFSDHRAFRCTFCSANFTQRSNLQRHSLKHVGFKPFICNVCNKAYYRKDHLVRHIEVSHPGSDPKSNITVKLSSSECLEYLEKMQINKLMEMSVMEGEQNNNFLTMVDNSSLLSDPVYGDNDSFSKSVPHIEESCNTVKEETTCSIETANDFDVASPHQLQISDHDLAINQECQTHEMMEVDVQCATACLFE